MGKLRRSAVVISDTEWEFTGSGSEEPQRTQKPRRNWQVGNLGLTENSEWWTLYVNQSPLILRLRGMGIRERRIYKVRTFVL